jgi:hypothetical protein
MNYNDNIFGHFERLFYRHILKNQIIEKNTGKAGWQQPGYINIYYYYVNN